MRNSMNSHLESSKAIAQRVIDLSIANVRPYALFMGRGVEMVPADGKRFQTLEAKPERMAQLVGIFDFEADIEDVAGAIDAARREATPK